MKLYIIGNGFDKAHGLKCSYWDFAEFIEKKYPKYFSCLMAAFNNDSGIWGDFETALPRCADELENWGLYMMEERLSEIDYTPTDDEGISAWLKEQYMFFKSLPQILRAWVLKMSNEKIGVAYQFGNVGNEDLFLNFNYTNTLEKYYGVSPERICHIHGDVGVPEETLIMGHGDKKRMEYANASLNSSVGEGTTIVTAVYKCVVDCLKLLYKDTVQIMDNKADFFNRLNHIEDVIVIGSSLSKADELYFDAIEEKAPSHWTFYCFKDDSPYRRFIETRNIPLSRCSIISDEVIKI